MKQPRDMARSPKKPSHRRTDERKLIRDWVNDYQSTPNAHVLQRADPRYRYCARRLSTAEYTYTLRDLVTGQPGSSRP